MTANNSNLALLIDADNVSAKIIVGLMAEIANYGTASVRRVYGDWTSPNMGSWKACLLDHSITPIQQFAYTTGKNATDGAMIIDAMDLLYTGRYSAFCLVSSDSDFTRLASRIREQAVTVYGFGERKTPRAFVAACNTFTYFDVLDKTFEEVTLPIRTNQSTAPKVPALDKPARKPRDKSPERSPEKAFGRPQPWKTPDPAPSFALTPVHPPRALDQAAIQGLARAITDCMSDGDDWVNLALVGGRLTKISPDLQPRNYGYQRLREFAEASGIVDLESRAMGDRPPIMFARLKENGDQTSRARPPPFSSYRRGELGQGIEI
jgi:uncharacterized LabA/DUF88 family protein